MLLPLLLALLLALVPENPSSKDRGRRIEPFGPAVPPGLLHAWLGGCGVSDCGVAVASGAAVPSGWADSAAEAAGAA